MQLNADQFNNAVSKSHAFYLLSTAVIANYFWVIFTEVGIKISFPEVGQKLNSPAIDYVLTVVNHTVQVVKVGLSGVTVSVFLH